MSDDFDDFGYFGDGLDGYVHYKQTFDDIHGDDEQDEVLLGGDPDEDDYDEDEDGYDEDEDGYVVDFDDGFDDGFDD